MSKTNFHFPVRAAGFAAGIIMSLVSGGAFAQTPKVSQSAKEEATIGEMTHLAKRLKVEKIRKDLRETTGEAEKLAAAAAAAANAPAPVRVARVPVEPTPPRVAAVVGVGQQLSAKLVDGQRVGRGSKVGIWRVVSIDSDGVAFERCDAKPPRKGTTKSSVPTECVTRFVAPGPNR